MVTEWWTAERIRLNGREHTTKSNAKMMKIIHNLLFSIYFWANSLHTMHTRRPHTHQRTRDTLSASYILSTPQRFSLLSSGLPAKSDETRTVMLVRHIERTHQSTTDQQKKKKEKTSSRSRSQMKLSFHIYLFFVASFFLRRISSGIVLFFALHCLRRVDGTHAENADVDLITL